MPKFLTIAQAMRATGLSRYQLEQIIEEYEVATQLPTKSGYKKYLIDPAKLKKIGLPISRRDVKQATQKEG